MPKTGPWTSLKNDATAFATEGYDSRFPPETILSRFVAAFGGAKKISSSGGIGIARRVSKQHKSGHRSGKGGKTGSISSGRDVGRRLGGFLVTAGTQGLQKALEELGLRDLVGKSASEVAMAILDRLAGPGSTLDEASARMALGKLMEEILDKASTYDDVHNVLKEVADDAKIAALLGRFFALYLYEWFCRCFYENWVKKVGSTKAAKGLKSIRGCIEASLAEKLYGINATKVDWNGPEGSRLATKIMKETLEIFEIES